MLEKIIAAIRVSSIQNHDSAFKFAKQLAPTLTEKNFSEAFTPVNLAEFELTTGSAKYKIAKLQQELKNNNLDTLIISTNDEYLNEYTPIYARRLFYITGFNGSYGFSVITQNSAALFVDGRYTEQAKQQVDPTVYKIIDLSFANIVNFVKDSLKTNEVVAIDSRSTSYSLANYFINAFKNSSLTLQFIDYNPIDNTWEKQPPKPLSPVVIYQEEYAGETATSKLAKVLDFMQEKQLNYYLVTATDDIAWLLNIRGEDVECTPLVLCTLLIKQDGSSLLFINQQKLSDKVIAYLHNLKVNINGEEELAAVFATLTKQKIAVTSESPYYYQQILQTNNVLDPNTINIITKIKCIKNSIEQKNTTVAHLKDGIALTKLIIWLNQTIKQQNLTEIEIANKLEAIKSEIYTFKGRSFDSIVAVNGNAAFPHYHASPEHNGVATKDSILLIDSGGQYLEGTTDVTRTLSFNSASAEFKRAFTLVLKGFIALSKIHFPAGSTGSNLDALARQFLWEAGENYNHGTGHGVGHYLGVHEDPIRINASNTTAFEAGMIVSIEPGSYKLNNFGIRIENLVLLIPSSKYTGWLEFKYLTLAPIDLKNIEVSLLNEAEKIWLNNYHQDVFKQLFSHLSEAEQASLKQLTAAI